MKTRTERQNTRRKTNHAQSRKHTQKDRVENKLETGFYNLALRTTYIVDWTTCHEVIKEKVCPLSFGCYWIVYLLSQVWKSSPFCAYFRLGRLSVRVSVFLRVCYVQWRVFCVSINVFCVFFLVVCFALLGTNPHPVTSQQSPLGHLAPTPSPNRFKPVGQTGLTGLTTFLTFFSVENAPYTLLVWNQANDSLKLAWYLTK